MSRIKTLAALVATFASSAPAFAHNGDHSANVLATLIHWLTQPTHSLFAMIGAVVFGVTLYTLSKKRA